MATVILDWTEGSLCWRAWRAPLVLRLWEPLLWGPKAKWIKDRRGFLGFTRVAGKRTW